MGQVAESLLRTGPGGAEARATSLVSRIRSRLHAPRAARDGAYLERGWVIANHKLVSFHAAFISSILSLSAVKLDEFVAQGVSVKSAVLRMMFSPLEMDLYLSLLILYVSWHIAIA